MQHKYTIGKYLYYFPKEPIHVSAIRQRGDTILVRKVFCCIIYFKSETHIYIARQKDVLRNCI